MKLIWLIALLPLSAIADRVDNLNSAPPIVQCQTRAGMIVQGVYAHYLGRTITAHIESRQIDSDALTGQERAYLEHYMHIGRIAAENWDKTPVDVTQWAAQEGRKFFESCVNNFQKSAQPRTSYLEVQSEHLDEFDYTGMDLRLRGCQNNLPLYFDSCFKNPGYSEAQIGARIKECNRETWLKFFNCVQLFPKPTLSEEIEAEI